MAFARAMSLAKPNEVSMIEVHDLYKTFGKHVALGGISFSVSQGEVVGFLGPNGAGKTTTMKILTGLIPSTSGQAHIAGRDVVDHPVDVRRVIGYLPEQPPLYGEMTVRGFLRFCAELRQVPRSQRASAVSEVVESCGLGEVVGRQIRFLSKGYRQRVGIAQAVIHKPKLLILDEPTSGLDPRQVVEIRTIVRTLGESCTVLLSSHILPEVTNTCDRVIIINRGRLVAEGSLADLTAGEGERLLLILGREDAAAAETLSRLPGVSEVLAEDSPRRLTVCTDGSRSARASVAEEAVRQGWGVEQLSPQRSSLEEVFLRVVTHDEDAA